MLTDGFNSEQSDPVVVADRIKAMGCSIHTRGIGGDQRAVAEELLRAISSRDQHGEPQYKFHTERAALVRDFGNIGRLTK
jgi:hypothetical protein